MSVFDSLMVLGALMVFVGAVLRVAESRR